MRVINAAEERATYGLEWKEGRGERCESCSSNDRRGGRGFGGRRGERRRLWCLVQDPQEWRHKMGQASRRGATASARAAGQQKLWRSPTDGQLTFPRRWCRSRSPSPPPPRRRRTPRNTRNGRKARSTAAGSRPRGTRGARGGGRGAGSRLRPRAAAGHPRLHFHHSSALLSLT